MSGQRLGLRRPNKSAPSDHEPVIMKAIKSNEPGFGAYARLSFGACCALCFLSSQHRYKSTTRPGTFRARELCESRGGRAVLLVRIKVRTVSVDVKPR